MTTLKDRKTTLDCIGNEDFIVDYDPTQVKSSGTISDTRSDESDSTYELDEEKPTYTSCPICPKDMPLKCMKAHLKSHFGQDTTKKSKSI